MNDIVRPQGEPPFVPRFSLASDIDEFVAELERFEKGELNPDEWRKFRLARGCYGQRQDDVQMQRIKIPMGYMTASQARAVARGADLYSAGKAHVTTRQNFQFHFVKLSDIPALMRVLDDAGITMREACGNAIRTVTGSELSGVDRDQVFDVRPHGEALTRFFLRHPKAAGLPRKFKMALSCTTRDCAQAAIHDVGFVAKLDGGRKGFKIFVGGGLSTSPEAAAVLYEFVPEEDILQIAEAVLMVFDARGNRQNKHRARLKYVLRDLGLEKLREVVDAERQKIAARNDPKPVFVATPIPPPPARERATSVPDAKLPGFVAWHASNVRPQLQDGYSAVYVRLPLGDVTSDQLREVATLAETYGDGSVWTSADQNLLLRFVPNGEVRALFAELLRVGLAKSGVGGLLDVTSCPGADSCNLAVTTSRGLGRAIADTLESAIAAGGARARAVEGAHDAIMKISGCPHSCGRHHIADIGFHGAARKIGGKAMPVYQLHIGGGVDEHGARFGAQVVKIPAKRVPAALLHLIETFDAQKAPGDGFGKWLGRLSADEIKLITKEYADIDPAVAKDDEYLDFDAQNGFVVETKAGECAALATGEGSATPRPVAPRLRTPPPCSRTPHVLVVPKELLRKLRRIEITTNRLANDQLAGRYASVIRGQGLAFREVRPYQAGDDVRAIDWNVSARMNEAYVKVFVEEREMTVMVVVDASKSQQFGTTRASKIEVAAEVTALSAFSAIRGNDRVGLILSTDRVEKIVPPKKGEKHAMRVVREVLGFEPTHTGTDLREALTALVKVTKRRSVAFVVSDFFASGFERALGLAAARHDVIPIMIVDPRDDVLPDVGLAEFEDLETGELVVVDTSSKAVRDAYAADVLGERAEKIALFRKLGLDVVTIETGKSFVTPIRDLFARRARRARR